MKMEKESVHHKNTMAIAWNNELKFQKLLEHHPF
jgi:hypothetical protein